MKKIHLILIFSILLFPTGIKAGPQGAGTNVSERCVIESVSYSGFDDSKISEPLREEAQKMVGVRYNEQTADVILKKLKDEFPGLASAYYRIAFKVEKGSKPDTVKVIFQSIPLVVPIKKLEPNVKIEKHSIVEKIVYNGIYENQISEPLREEAQKMVGMEYDQQAASRILEKLQNELPALSSPYYRTILKMEQGSRPGSVKVIFQQVTGTFPVKKPEPDIKGYERSIVESVVYNGIYESKISRPLRDEAQKMVGAKFSVQTANGTLKKLRDEFPELDNEWHRILLKVEKGSKQNEVRVVFQVVVGIFQVESNISEPYVVESVVYSGIDESKISRPLRAEAQKMVGVKYNEQTASDTRKKLQQEFPEINNGTARIILKLEQGSKPDVVKVVFQLETNPYEPYVVEAIAYNGIYESRISRPLRDEAQKMIGVKYNEKTAKAILKTLKAEFPELNNEAHQIILKVDWGKPGTVKVIFQLISVIFQPKEPESNASEGSVVERIVFPVLWESKISQDLRDEAQKMVGMKYNEHTANGILRKLQEELPDFNNESYRITLNVEKGSKPDTVKMVFAVTVTAMFQPVNVNERYIVESVGYSGIDESKISQDLRNEAQKMVGVKYNEQTANGILGKLKEEVKKGNYEITLRVEKGNNPDEVKVVYQFKKRPFVYSAGAGGVYHSQEGTSISVGTSIEDRTYHNVFSFSLLSESNLILERYTGFKASYENKKIGTERVRLKADFESYHEKFNLATKEALSLRPDVPGVYRARQSFSPYLTIQPLHEKYIEIQAGLDFERLEFQTPVPNTQNAYVGFTNFAFNACDILAKSQHCGTFTYNLRTATRDIGSDFIYTRHIGSVTYAFTEEPHELVASVSYGLITGTPPMFERFALGNSFTLRGWNKFDVSPLGGTHTAFGMLQYRYRRFRVFYDIGTEWDKNEYSPVRHGIGCGIVNWPFKHMTFSIAFPVRLHNVKPVFGVF
jgi:molybdopterin-biosynthesis enzyme MoeA-like protein